MQMQPVQSSMLSHVGYDPDTRELHVTFKDSGETYQYHDIAPQAHQAMMSAPSIGKHFNANVRAKAKSVKI